MPIILLACKCGGPYDVETEYKSSDLIFLGQVLNVEYVGLEETKHPDSAHIARSLAPQRSKAFLDESIILKATFLVKKKYKGEFKSDTLIIYTGNRSPSCGINFLIGKAYGLHVQSKLSLWNFGD